MKDIESAMYVRKLVANVDDVMYVASKMARDHRYLINEWFKVVYGMMHSLAIKYEQGDAYPDMVMQFQYAAQFMRGDDIIYRSEWNDREHVERVEKAAVEDIYGNLPEAADNDRDIARQLSDLINGRMSDNYVVGGILADASNPMFAKVYRLFFYYTKYLSILYSKGWYDPRDEWATKVAHHWMPADSHFRNEEHDAELCHCLNL